MRFYPLMLIILWTFFFILLILFLWRGAAHAQLRERDFDVFTVEDIEKYPVFRDIPAPLLKSMVEQTIKDASNPRSATCLKVKAAIFSAGADIVRLQFESRKAILLEQAHQHALLYADYIAAYIEVTSLEKCLQNQ